MAKFTKQERLCSKVEIDELFSTGKSFLVYPFSVRYSIKENSDNPQVKILVSAPKKYNKLSVNRNRVKRIIRESYRKNKEIIISLAVERNLDISFFISLIIKDIPSFELADSKIQKILSKIIDIYSSKDELNT